MARRKATDDVMARTEAERVLGNEMEATGTIDSTNIEPAEAGRRVLDQVAAAVEFETGVSKDPDGKQVPMRRLVITGPWTVDPDGLTGK
jgi:hypothetical protein